MAIGDGKSVLIIGAGVSAPFNVPLGGGMIDEICAQIRRERVRLGARADMPLTINSPIGDAFRDIQIFYDFPIHATIGLAAKNRSGTQFVRTEFQKDMEALCEFERLLTNQTSDSIDDFIVQNPELSRLSKTAVAAIIFLRCYKPPKIRDCLEVRPLEGRSTRSLYASEEEKDRFAERNWIHLLINIARDKYFLAPPEPERRMKIVTFNYDTILEHVLERQFQNTQRSYGHYTDYFDIVHVHGRCGFLAQEVSGNGAAIVESWADGIHVVREEAVSPDVEVDRSLAKAWVQSARNIHCVGFAFARANITLLGLDKCETISSLNYCNYNRSVGVKKNAELCKSKDRTLIEDSNDDARPLRVSDWFSTGYAGELPS